jgi:site-specific recombinase XerD
MSKHSDRKLNPPSFTALVQSFFAEHLTQQRGLSARTVAAYRDAFLLFLQFAQARLHKAPSSSPSSIIWRAIVTTRFAAAMRGWPRCAHS